MGAYHYTPLLLAASPVAVSLLLLCVTGFLLVFFKFRWGVDDLRFALSTEMSQRLGREVRVEHLSGNILTNVVLHDVSIARESRLEAGTLLRAARVVVRYRLGALLKRELAPAASVSVVEIEAPQVFLERSQEGKLNLLELIKPRKPTPPDSRFRGRMVLRNGWIDYLDHTLPAAGQPLHLVLRGVEADADFGVLDRLKLSFRSSDLSTPNSQPSTVKGQLSLDSASRTTALSLLASNLDLEAFAPHIQQARRLGRISGSATVHANLLIKSSPEPRAKSQKPTVDYRVAFSTPHSFVSLPQLPQPVHFSGAALLSPGLAFLDGLKVAGIGFVGSVTGDIRDFSRPQLRLNIEADYLDPNRFRAYLPPSARRFAFDFAAPAKGSFAVWGDLRRPLATGQLALPSLSLSLPRPQGPSPTLGASQVRLHTAIAWPPHATMPALSATLALQSPQVRNFLPGREAWWPTDLSTSGPVYLDLRWVEGRPAAEGRFDLNANEWELMGTRFPFQVNGKFALGPKAFSLQKVVLASPFGQVEANACFLPDKRDGRWSVEGRMEGVRLDRLAALLPSQQPLGSDRLGGSWQADFAFNSSSRGKDAMVRGELSDFRYASASSVPTSHSELSQSAPLEPSRRLIELRKVSCLVKVDEDTLDIGSVAVSDPALRLLLHGTLPLGMEGLALLARGQSPPALEEDCDLHLALDGADLAQLPLPLPISGNATGRVRLHGPASLPLVEAEMFSEFGFTPSHSNTQSAKHPTRNSKRETRNLGEERMVALVKASGTSARLVLDKFTLSGARLRAEAEGEVTGLYVAGKSRPRCDLQLTAESCDLSSLLRLNSPDSAPRAARAKAWDFPLAGRPHVALAVQGPLNNPAVSGSASLKSGFLLGEEVERAEAELAYRAGVLSVSRLSAESALFSLEGSGQLKPEKGGGAVEATFDLSEISPGALANSLGLSGRAFAGSLEGKGKVEGTLSSPRAELTIQGQEILVGKTNLAAVSTQLAFAEGTLAVKAEGNGPQGTVHLRGEAVPSTGRVNGLLDGKSLDLEDLSRTFAAVGPRDALPTPRLLSTLQGNANLSVKFSGSFLTDEGRMKPPDVEVALRAQPLSLLKEQIADLKLNASYARNKVQIAELRAVTGQEHFVASGFVSLPPSGQEKRMRIAATGSGLALNTLARLLPSKIPGEVGGKAIFGALLEGPLDSPEVDAFLEVDKPRLSALAYDHLRLDVTLETGKALGIKAEFGSGKPGSEDWRGGMVKGNLPFSWRPLGLRRDQEIDLAVAIQKDDLASIAGLVPRLTRASAPISLDLKVGGTPQMLEVDGSVSLSSGEIDIAGSPSDLSDLFCELNFESRTEPGTGPVNKLEIGELKGKFLDGTFDFSGAATRIVSFAPSQALKNDYNLSLALDDLDLSKLNRLLESPSVEEPGAVSFELPALKAEAEINIGRGEGGFTEVALKKVSAAGPKGALLACRGKVTLTQTDPSKLRNNLFDLTLEMRKFETRVIPYFHGEINTKAPVHLSLKNPSGEPVRMKGDLEITKGVMTMAARKEPPAPREPGLRPEEEPFWNVQITPGRDFFILLPRFRQPMDGEITITGAMLSPFIQGRLWARPGGRLVSLSEQWRTEKCDVDFWASVSRSEAGWAAQYNGAIDFKALGQVTYRDRKHDVAMTLSGDLLPTEEFLLPEERREPGEVVLGPLLSFEATPFLTQQEIFAALGHAEVVERIMAGENAREVLSQEIFSIGEAEAARAILDPIGSELKEALGLEALSLEYGFDSPIRIRLTKDIARGITLSYVTTVTAAREEYQVQGAYRLPERFSRGARPKTVGVSYDETKTIAGDLRWEWQF